MITAMTIIELMIDIYQKVDHQLLKDLDLEADQDLEEEVTLGEGKENSLKEFAYMFLTWQER